MSKANLGIVDPEETAGLVPTANAITALVGGGQAATPTAASVLTAIINRVTTVTSAADSVTLPVSAPGLFIVVMNSAAANSMNVFPNVGGTATEKINALSANAAFAMAANKTAIFYCAVAGQWNSILTA